MLRRRREPPKIPGAPRWMVTWGDMMSLLLSFFVLLAAFSTISEKKLNQALASLQGALGAAPQETAVPREEQPAPPPTTIESVARDLQQKMQVLGRDQEIKIEYDKQGGLRIVLPDRFLFDTARAEVKPDSFPVLQSVGELLSDIPDCFIEVRGHTDSRPLVASAKYRDNYDLSYARADNIARRVQAYGHFLLDQFEIVSCGPGQPVATNDTEEGQRANRRVEIIVRGTAENRKMTQLQAGG